MLQKANSYQLRIRVKRNLLFSGFFVILLFTSGCAGFLNITENPPEIYEAEDAIKKAIKEGKDIQCTKEFNAALKMQEKADKLFWACYNDEAAKYASKAIEMTNALCPPPEELKTVVYFDLDKAVIRENNKKDKENLDHTVDFLKKHPGSKIIIEGHTCSTGTEEYNQRLSERRAEAIKKYLIKKTGIDPSQFTTNVYGELKPAAANNTIQGRRKNRRAEINIVSE